MSRTYRRKNSYDEYWYTHEHIQLNELRSIKYHTALYHSDACRTMNQCPSWFKRGLRKQFRHRCKQVLRDVKAGNIDYAEIIFPINYKDALWNWW